MAKTLSQKDESIVGPLRRRRQSSQQTSELTDRSIETLIVIGSSAGGHQALRQVIRELSDDIPAAVIILLHMPPTSPSHPDEFQLEEWLRISTHIPIVRVQSGARLRSGMIFIAPPGMSVSLKGRVLHVTARESRTTPVVTINTLFESVAREYRDRVIGVILTGLLRDGTDGLKAVHEAGGLTIVQDPTGAEYPDMPASAMKDLPVTFCLDLAHIGPTLDLLARRKTALETGLAFSVRFVKERVALLARLLAQSKRNSITSQFLTTEMIALERDLAVLEALVTKALIEDKAERAAG
jgi:chemotaxis response regulator CheB